MQSRYQGDPKISINENGMDIVFVGGQPEMDKGLSNAVFISLLTRPGWVGAKIQGADQIKGSNFLVACERALTVKTINEIRQAAEKALAWVDGKVAVVVKNPTGNKLEIAIGIKLPSDNLQVFLLSREGLHWYFQIYGS